MNGKICASPKGGGSGRGAVRYILGYSLGSHEKDDTSTPKERGEAFDRLQAEGLAREDLGVGRVWYPAEGREGRPAAILANGVTSLVTADQEMDSYAAVAVANGVKEPTMHLVFSFSPDESGRRSWDEKMAAVQTALEDMGLGHHAYVAAGHADVAHHHVHVAVSSIDPETLLSWERNRDRFRISRACRVAEIEHDLDHDRGLYKVRDEDGVKTVELTSTAERKTWAREDREGRLDQQTRKALGDYAKHESAESWAEVVEVKIRRRVEAMEDAGLTPTWADAHSIAAAHGARIVADDDGAVRFEIRERLDKDARKAALDDRDHDSDDDGLDHEEKKYEPVARIEAPRTKDTGTFVAMNMERVGMRSEFEDAARAEETLAQRVREEPSYVSRVITNVEGNGIFDRSDVDRFLANRITDAVEVAELSDYVLDKDDTITMKTADTKNPTFVQKHLQALEERVVERATRLANTKDDSFDVHAFERACVNFENAKREEQIKRGEEATFALTREQRELCEAAAQNKLAWCNGSAGAGKTTSMKVLALYAHETNREVVGLATSASAAEKLGNDAGIRTFNLAKAIVEERAGRSVIPENAFVIVDESSMTSYDHLDDVLHIVELRGGNAVAIGGKAQIQNIEAGSPHAVMLEIAQGAGTRRDLTEVRRQQGELLWMREEVALVDKAIFDGDGAGVVRFVKALDDHGCLTGCTDRDATITAAAEWLLENPERSILAVNDRETAKHINAEIMRGLGLTGTGAKFETENGTRELAVGARMQFQKISKRSEVSNGGVLNGDLGTITALDFDERRNRWTVSVQLDKDDRIVSFDPMRYRSTENAWAISAFKAQGQSVYRAGTILDAGTSANTAFVELTRGTDELRGWYAETNFADAGEVATHLADRIAEDKDVMLLDRVIAKTGGKETAWAKNVLAAREKADHPLRKRYAQEQRARQVALDAKRLAMTEAASAAMRQAQTEQERSAVLRRLSEATAGIQTERMENTKTTFAMWAVANKPQIERDAERQQAVERARQERVREREAPTRDRPDRSSRLASDKLDRDDHDRGGRSR